MPKHAKILFSYRSRDTGLARQIARELRKCGIEIVSPTDEPVSGLLRVAVQRAAKKCAAMVILIGSADDPLTVWAEYEMGIFDALEKPILVLVSNAVPASSLPIELVNNRRQKFDPNSPEVAARLVASDILEAV